MMLLGLLLMSASGAFVGLLIADNLSGGPEYQVTILGNDLVTLNALGIFLSGVALALIFCLGLALMRSTRRSARPVEEARPVHRRARYHWTGYREYGPEEPEEEAVERREPVRRESAREEPVRGESAREEPVRGESVAEREEPGAEPDRRETTPPPRGRMRHLFGH